MSSTTNTSSKRFVSLIDPASKAGMLHIPMEKTMDTKGRNDWLKGALRKDLSLCCLFQKGRCHAGERCHQVHVDRVYMESLRAQQAKIISCCRKCNDTASLAPDAVNFFALHFGVESTVAVSAIDGSDAVNVIDADNVAYTTGLVNIMENATRKDNEQIVLPGKKVCRLHLRGACKYGKDCKNIHLCSKLGESILAAPKVEKTQPKTQTTGIATRAAPKPVAECTAPTKQQEVAPKPLPSFSSLLSRNTTAALPKDDSLHLSCSERQLDALDVKEFSGRLTGIVFDPKKALEESARTGAMRFDFTGSEAMWLGAVSPGQKRRGSTASSNGTCDLSSASDSLSRPAEWNPFMASATEGQQQGDFLRIFC